MNTAKLPTMTLLQQINTSAMTVVVERSLLSQNNIEQQF
jgi:hypothetical protein